MKIPKTTNRYCPYCKAKTAQKVKLVSTGAKRGTLTRGSINRAKLRGRGVGMGNKGKWGSKPAISKFKRTGAKLSKKTNLKFTCEICKKTLIQKKGFRTKKLVFE